MILIAEDSRSIQAIYKSILGDTCIIGKNGKEALSIYDEIQDNVKLIISDVEMPEMDGFRFVEEIRSQNADVPIIVVSTFEQKDSLETVFASEDVFRLFNKTFQS